MRGGKRTKLARREVERAAVFVRKHPEVPLAEVARRYGVARMTLWRMIGAASRPPGRRGKLGPEQLKKAAALVKKRPDLSMPVIAMKLGVSRTGLYRALDRVEGRQPRVRGGRPKLTPKEIERAVALARNRGDRSLVEIAAQIGICRTTLWRILHQAEGRPQRLPRKP